MTEMEMIERGCDAATRAEEMAAKRRRIEALLDEGGYDALVISRHENLAWVSAGVVDVRVGLLRETGPASVMIGRDGRTYLLTTNNEERRLGDEEFAGLGYEAVVQPWYGNDVAGRVAQLAGGGKVAADAPLAGCAVVSLQGLREELMASEVLRYRWAGRQAAEAATEVLLALRPGMSERVMQGMLAERLMSVGMLPSVFLTAVDERIRQYRHAVPRGGVLERFGMVGFCARQFGLTISMTRLVHFGAMPAELEEKFRVVAAVNARLQASTRTGATGDVLFAEARAGYAAGGYAGEETRHHQGGATGYGEREWVARPGGGEVVRRAQAFAWNPNLQGAKVEDTVVHVDGVVELLTGTPRLPEVRTEWAGKEYVSAGVLVV